MPATARHLLMLILFDRVQRWGLAVKRGEVLIESLQSMMSLSRSPTTHLSFKSAYVLSWSPFTIHLQMHELLPACKSARLLFIESVSTISRRCLSVYPTDSFLFSPFSIFAPVYPLITLRYVSLIVSLTRQDKILSSFSLFSPLYSCSLC